MLSRTLKIGTRTSPFALKQVDEIVGHLKEFYPEIKVEIVGIDTYGDRDENYAADTFNILTPHPLQGALAVEVRKNNEELRNILGVLNGR